VSALRRMNRASADQPSGSSSSAARASTRLRSMAAMHMVRIRSILLGYQLDEDLPGRGDTNSSL
jgi:hypothetical protein